MSIQLIEDDNAGKNIVYTCPKCGNDLQEICLTSLPPQYRMECWQCGWSETKQVKQPETIRIPYSLDTLD